MLTENQDEIIRIWDNLVTDAMTDEYAIWFVANHLGIEPMEVLEALDAVNKCNAH